MGGGGGVVVQELLKMCLKCPILAEMTAKYIRILYYQFLCQQGGGGGYSPPLLLSGVT